ncbi:MAG: short chain dehydrogenase [Gallionellales bacterium 35-53-114]|jgi:citronellol/citronellal dehydrogenase|nr:MAG: short chain dehydrogenase [Gallionellales bacterium 35-53-114]OYZ65290.1 MAG: short chain dehydrogenase [Gallionellales bacterium 24-53-125]OZB08196.1 MAG: short chain dehydrogenase [Gallionellales bacterium 39-52-133]HQS58122.1 NAD(P)-dependent oxidoreductase [Gallionellaceae bacterium]HQS73677.1 NAD(P)-dependent oxidoreductase [Gallionellaceae bacterium]
MNDLRNKTIFITGATRGIGRAIALRCARDGANVVITGKTAQAHAKLPGTIHSVAEEVDKAGGKGLALQLDVRDERALQAAVEQAAARFGGIDVLVNNASAISLTGTLETPARRLDLMWEVNMRATFLASQACIPHLKKSSCPHILTLSPPLSYEAKWFAPHVAYTISKFGMSMCALGMAREFAEDGIAVNCLWPRTTIATSAIEFNFPQEILHASRKPEIVADAAHHIFMRNSRECSGNFFIDEDVLREAGVTDFSRYAVTSDTPLFNDLFLEERKK